MATPLLIIPQKDYFLRLRNDKERGQAEIDNYLAIELWSNSFQLSPGGRAYATRVVAASNSLQATSNVADYVCTGTNDQAKINQAMTDVGAGGKVLLMDGTFNINIGTGVVSVPSNVTLEGMGASTILKATVNAAQDVVATATAGTSGVQIRNLTIDGNNGGSVTGLHIYRATGVAVDNVLVANCGTNGVKIHQYNVIGMSNVHLNNVVTSNCTANGFTVFGDTPGSLTNLILNDCIAGGANIGFNISAGSATYKGCIASGGNLGFYVTGVGGQFAPVLFDSCQSLGHGGFEAVSNSYTSFVNCAAHADASPTFGFNANGMDGCKWVGCQAIGYTGGAAVAGFYFEGAMVNNMVDECMARNNLTGFLWSNDAAGTHNNNAMRNNKAHGNTTGCNIQNSCSNLLCVLNDFHGNTTNFLNTGVGTLLNLDGSANNWNRIV